MFAGVDDLASAAGVDAPGLRELTWHCYHRSPSDLLLQARIDLACRRLRETSRSLAEIAADVGFETRAQFELHFKRVCRLSPQAYRDLRQASEFEIALPSWLLRDALFAYWKRDPRSVTERVEGTTLSWALRLQGRPALLLIELAADRARCQVSGSKARNAAFEAHGIALRLLGLHLDPRPFEHQVDSGPWRALIAGRLGWTPPQTANLFDGLVWVIAGQQVSLPAAFSIRRRLNSAFGKSLGDGWVVPPSPAALAEVEPEELAQHGLTRRKAAYLSALARRFEHADDAERGWGFEAWRWLTAPEAEQRLLACKGLGPWSVGYLMMRSLGFANCVPLGDVVLQRQLRRFFDLERRPNAEQTLELMRPFAPYRSLATFHFWALPSKS